MSKDLIVVKGLTKSYGKKVKTDVLKKVDLTIKEHSLTWIVGASGSGKTTLLNLITGLDEASAGEVYISDKLITKMNEKERANFRSHHLGFVFQFHYLLPEFNALENILLPLRIQKKRVGKTEREEALKLMETVGISHVYNHYPKEMSGGEQQRTAIARAIMGKPKLIIADEPTGNLDSASAEQVYSLIRELHTNLQTTFIIVTHANIKPLKGDRIITLKDGEIIKDVLY